MFANSTKVVAAALVLAATSLGFLANASARPNQGGWQGGESFMQERHDPTNTNGY